MKDETALESVRTEIKLNSCPHCRHVGALVSHGFLRGYAERSGESGVVRGRRFFCSNRHRRGGCGRTFSVALATVLSGFVVRTLTLLTFVRSVLVGWSRRAAWFSAAGAFSLSSGYRLWQRLTRGQSALRARLCREAPPPPCTAREPLSALLGHLGVVVLASEGDLFAGFQEQLQRGLFAP